MTKKPGRGGQRDGAGRPPDPTRKIHFTARLPAEVAAWLDERKANDPSFNKNAWIGATLQAAIDRIIAGKEASK